MNGPLAAFLKICCLSMPDLTGLCMFPGVLLIWVFSEWKKNWLYVLIWWLACQGIEKTTVLSSSAGDALAVKHRFWSYNICFLVEPWVTCPQLLSTAMDNSAVSASFPFVTEVVSLCCRPAFCDIMLWYSQMYGVNMQPAIVTISSLVQSSRYALYRCQGAVDLNSLVGRTRSCLARGIFMTKRLGNSRRQALSWK